MPAKYTQKQKKFAKDHGQEMVAIDAGRVEFSGPVTADERREVEEFLLGFLERRGLRLKAEAAAAE